jgi:hypothetical protein
MNAKITQFPVLGMAVLAACTLEVDTNHTATVTGGDPVSTSDTAGTSASTSASNSTSDAPTTGPGVPTCGTAGETDETQQCPESCADVLAEAPGAADGAYTLYVRGDPTRPWQAWCVGMGDMPAEYLILPMVGPGYNFSEYVPGPSTPGTTVRTTYSRIRIDPRSFLVDVSDQTFSSSVGSLVHDGSKAVTSMPYAVAMDCVGALLGRANIDLRETPFMCPPEQFMMFGHLPERIVLPSSNYQVIDIRGSGECGYVGPNPGNNPDFPIDDLGGFYLQLLYAQ